MKISYKQVSYITQEREKLGETHEVVYLNESGIEREMEPTRGERVIAIQAGKRYKRLNIIGWLMPKQGQCALLLRLGYDKPVV